MKSGILCLSLGLVLLTGCAASAEDATPAMETDEQKALYAAGFAISKNLQNLDLTAEEVDLVQLGMKDGLLGLDEKIDIMAFMPKLEEIFNARVKAKVEIEKAAGLKTFEAAKTAEGSSILACGAVYTETSAGSGAQPAITDTVQLHYHGTLHDGTMFDSSVERGEPAEFALNGVVPCFGQGVAAMKVGGKATLTCPPDTAYGDAGRPGILPGSTLIFEVELLDIITTEQPSLQPAPDTSPSK
jgi:FKBP-type peptidyl-prolyl cis-trans isomerase FkpA